MMLCDGMLFEKSLITAFERNRSSSEARLTKASRQNCNFMEVRINYRPSHPVKQLFS